MLGLRELVQVMKEKEKLSTDQVQKMASLLRDGRDVLNAEVAKGGEMLDVLQKFVDDRSGNFKDVYGSVFTLISKKEPGFAEFTALAAQVAKDTKEKHPDFYQSANDFLPIWTQAINIHPTFTSFCESVVAKASGKPNTPKPGGGGDPPTVRAFLENCELGDFTEALEKYGVSKFKDLQDTELVSDADLKSDEIGMGTGHVRKLRKALSAASVLLAPVGIKLNVGPIKDMPVKNLQNNVTD